MAKEMSERKQREFDLRRTYIIDTAEKLFYQFGYEAVTLNQLAEAVHYTKATLYTYLSCKDEIYLEVYCRGFEKRTEYLYQNMKHCDTGFEEVKNFGEAYFTFYKENPEILFHQQYLDFRPLEFDKLPQYLVNRFMQLNDKSSKLIIDALQKGIDDGSIKSDLKISNFLGQLVLTLRACASAVVSHKRTVINEPWSDEVNTRWYNSYLELILSAIKGKNN
jgi:AcrR family transcriptional regulator